MPGHLRLHAVNFKDDDYEVAIASTDEEIKQLGKAGWVKYDDKNGVSYYRKLKKFRRYESKWILRQEKLQ